MSLLAMNSFDQGVLDPSMIGDTYSLDTGNKRTGIASLRLGTASQRYYNFTASGRIFMGAAVYVSTVTAGYPKFIFYGDGGSVIHAVVGIDQSTSKWQARRASNASMTSGTALATDAGAVAQTARWYYVEAELTIDDAAGVCNVWVDGVQVIAFVGDTRNGGTNLTIDRAGVQGDSGTSYSYFDDLYICNDQGSVNNTRIGDVDVVYLRPNGAGSYSNLTPSTGSNYQNVDESGTPNTADYNSSASASTRDLYTMDDLPGNAASVKAARVMWYGKKAAAGAAGFAPVDKVTYGGGSTRVGTGQPLALTDQLYAGDIQELDAWGSPWTPTNVNGVEAGAQTT